MGISFGISCKVGEIPHFTTLPRKHKKRAEGCPPLFSQRPTGSGSVPPAPRIRKIPQRRIQGLPIPRLFYFRPVICEMLNFPSMSWISIFPCRMSKKKSRIRSTESVAVLPSLSSPRS